MASPIITPLPIQTDTEYRPISKLAVVGFILSLPCLLIFTSENLFWMLIVPVMPAVIICYVALRSIRSSEGNLAGEPIAIIGIVIAVGCGLGWLTMSLVTKYVTEIEAKAAVEEWIGKLQKQELGAAFLLSKPGSARRLNFNPEELNRLRKQFPHDQYSSEFDSFLLEPISGQYSRYGDKVKMKYADLIEAKIQRGDNPVYRFRYVVESPTVEGSCIIVASAENNMTDEGIRRDWIVRVDNNANYTRDTPYGGELSFVSNRAQDIAERVAFSIANDEPEFYGKMLDKNNQGEFPLVLGYFRDKDRRGIVQGIGLQKPMRLRSDKKEGKRWTLVYDCTMFIEGERGVDFSMTLTSEEPATDKWQIQNVRFLGLRKIQTNKASVAGETVSAGGLSKPKTTAP